jgi:hypothetical protein
MVKQSPIHNITGVHMECVPCGAFLTSKVREYNDAIDMVLPREGRRAM